MTPLWTSDAAAAATGGRLVRPWSATGVSIDSRTLRPGDLFVALEAARDGHDFVADALSRGAAAALVARPPAGVAPDAPLLIVPDVLEALRALGAAARRRFRGRVVAVTGSAGKTGTKDMLRAALQAQGTRVHAAEKSYNNHWGVPLTLARMPADADYAVIEIGMNAPGEIEPLARLARPHVALVTTVAPVHLAAFADLRAIAREKGAIFAGLEANGTAVINRDLDTYPVLLAAARAAGARPLRFGSQGRPEFRLVEARMGDTATVVDARVFEQPFLFKLGAPGRHLAMNALGAMACLHALGADLALAGLALATWRVPEGRGARCRIALGPEGRDGVLTLIDESYNANPAAMEAAFEIFAAARPEPAEHNPRPPRRIAFLGDMLELGPAETALHEGLAGIPALRAADTVHCAGPRMRALHARLPRAQRGEWFETAEDLAARAPRLVGPGDIAMVKGSNGSRIALVVAALKRLGAAREATGGGEQV